ncbi:DUF6443 domain-containing protein, partial [Arcticibacter sp.]|uniref:DUF6443 domain-containing protein n=1 Tax=Arcticibacter sp. TaxID=1872630 RepID=UPI00388F6C11
MNNLKFAVTSGIMSRIGILLLLAIAWKGAAAQSGTSMYDAFPIPVTGCGTYQYWDYQDNSYGFSDNYGNSSPDVWYSFSLSQSTNIIISLCGSNFDTYLRVLDQNGSEILSNDDSGVCGGTNAYIASSLGAGTYYIVAEGYSSYTGDINLSFEVSGSGTASAGSNMSNAIDGGTYGSPGTFTDTRSNADGCLGNNIGQPSNDIYYRFAMPFYSTITLSHCGSNIDTYMHVLDGAGNVIATNDDNYNSPCPGTQAYIQISLGPGTYYVVSEGYGSYTGNIVTTISMGSSGASTPSISYTLPAFMVGVPVSVSPVNTGGAVYSGGQSTSTLAGSGNAGFANGTGTGASFYNPLNSAVDASGNVYVADAGNHSIRKVTPSGVVSTFAGAGYAGFANGTGTAAVFRHPSFIAVDASGNLYVSDQQNHRIRKITPGGVVSTFAGSGSIGSANGTGTAASFQYPMGLAFDASGNLYVADAFNHRIRKITPAGVVSTFAGTGVIGSANGAALSSTFNYPMGLAFDAGGNLNIADRSNFLIRKISPAGIVSTLAGNGTRGFADGAGAQAMFDPPNNLVVDGSGNVYVADQNNNRIRKITPDGIVSTLAGAAIAGTVNGTGAEVRLNSPFGISRDAGTGYMYVADINGQTIRKMVLLRGYSISPQLPSGLVFNETTGTISGTPTTVSAAATYTVTAYNGAGSNTTTLSIAVASAGGASLSQDQNYIVTYTPREAFSSAENLANKGPGEVMQSVQYFDGLGRPLQSVQVRGNPGADKDIVIPVAYDAFGREVKKYLPYASSSNNGSYKANAIADQQSFYTAPPIGVTGIPNPFAETLFEPSPLNRVVEQGAPGTAWQIGGGHTARTEYGTNNADPFISGNTAGSGRVALYTAVTGANNTRILSRVNHNAVYANSQLYLTITRDENWQPADGCLGTSEEYKDKQGQVVLKRTYNRKGSTTEMLSTYYVYDDFGNLSFVLPPASHPDADAAISSTTLNDLCYQYRYDGRNRMTGKKLPGKGWELMIYNQIDQLVLSQDAVQRAKSPQQWSFTKYNAFGQVVMTGVYTDASGAADAGASPGDARRTVLQAQVNDPLNILWESRLATAETGYSNSAFPTTDVAMYLSINYYDDYAFPGGNPYPKDPNTYSQML